MSELEHAIEKWDINNGMMTHELQTIVNAARRVANLNRAAAFDAVHHILWIELEVDVSDEVNEQIATRVVDAALGIITEDDE